MRRFSLGVALTMLSVFLALPVAAQNRTYFAGTRAALPYAYGVPLASSVSAGAGAFPQPLVVDNPSITAVGTATIIVAFGSTTAGDGTIFVPLNANAPLFIGGPTNQEKVTPTSVSCSTPTIYDTCTFTATFANAHGRGEQITSATFGLQEAINLQFASGGGEVAVDIPWQQAGGTTAMLSAATAFSNVVIQDNRGGVPTQYWSMQPTTLTLLAAPTTLTASTAVFAGTTGTWTNAAQFTCITFVDALGGEGPCSATFNQTPAANTVLTITAPAASTGAVGWRAYAGASYANSFLLPVTTAACTLSTLETVIPACSMSSNGVWPAIFVNTTTLKPAPAIPLAAANNPVPQGHTTFGYLPTPFPPQPFQSNYGPFAVMSGGTTAGQVAVLGTMNLPVGYLNVIGRTIRVSGKVAANVNTATTPQILVSLGWVGGTSAGAPVTVCSMTSTVAFGASTTFNLPFTCTMTTNAVGATAVGTIQTDGSAMASNTAGTTAASVFADNNTAAVGSLGLFAQDTVFVYFVGATNVTSSLQLMDLHVETLL